MTSNADRVVYHEDLHFKPTGKFLLIIDEADDVFWKNPEKFFSACDNNLVICFTATTSFRHEDQTDRKLLERQGFKVRQYWPESLKAPSRLFTESSDTLKTREQMVEFLKTQINHQPVLLYCHHDDMVFLE